MEKTPTGVLKLLRGTLQDILDNTEEFGVYDEDEGFHMFDERRPKDQDDLWRHMLLMNFQQMEWPHFVAVVHKFGLPVDCKTFENADSLIDRESWNMNGLIVFLEGQIAILESFLSIDEVTVNAKQPETKLIESDVEQVAVETSTAHTRRNSENDESWVTIKGVEYPRDDFTPETRGPKDWALILGINKSTFHTWVKQGKNSDGPFRVAVLQAGKYTILSEDLTLLDLEGVTSFSGRKAKLEAARGPQ